MTRREILALPLTHGGGGVGGLSSGIPLVLQPHRHFPFYFSPLTHHFIHVAKSILIFDNMFNVCDTVEPKVPFG